jgi:threonyl-tRNA synthetase
MNKISVSLPDGSVKELDQGATVHDLAASIGAGLAKASIAGKVDEQLVDLHAALHNDAKVEIITEKSPEALEIIRHSTSHLMAQAVKQLFPKAKVTIGPAIENGFYYDFDVDAPFSPEDLKNRNENEGLAKANLKVERQVLKRDDAINFSGIWAKNTRLSL